MEKKELIVLTGPTAVGKTELSLSLAKKVGGEIISADSMQVYRGMDIGTAKIQPDAMQGVRHHLIDICEPHESFHVMAFQQMAKKAMEGIYERGHIPILTGGTGFYIQSVLYDIHFTDEKTDKQYRKELETIYREKGSAILHQMLEKVDEESAKKIHAHNVKRVIRALEYYKETGEKFSVHNEREALRSSPYCFRYYVLTMPREILYRRINDRVEQMVKQGLLEEVKTLYEQGYDRSFVSMQGLGYKECCRYFEGELSLEEAITLIKRDTRHFAKRQLTWFRKEKDVCMLDKMQFEDEAALLSYMLQDLQKHHVIDSKP